MVHDDEPALKIAVRISIHCSSNFGAIFKHQMVLTNNTIDLNPALRNEWHVLLNILKKLYQLILFWTLEENELDWNKNAVSYFECIVLHLEYCRRLDWFCRFLKHKSAYYKQVYYKLVLYEVDDLLKFYNYGWDIDHSLSTNYWLVE